MHVRLIQTRTAVVVVKQLVFALVAAARAKYDHVLQLDQPRQMTPNGEVAPAGRVTYLALGEPNVQSRRSASLCKRRNNLATFPSRTWFRCRSFAS